MLRIALKSREIEKDELPPSNLVFLIDVSGSMDGAESVAIKSTKGSNKREFLKALENLEEGGSTAGVQGIERAYQITKENLNDDTKDAG